MKIYQYYNFSDNGRYVNFGFLDTLKQVGGGLKSAWDAFHGSMQAPTEAQTLAQENAEALAGGEATPEVAEDGTVKGPGILKRVGNFFGNMFKKKDVPPEGTNPDTPDYAKPGYQGEKDATLVEAEGMLDTKSPYFDDKKRKGLGGLWDNITGKGPKPDVEGAAKLLQDKAREEAAQEAEAQKAAAEKAAAQKAQTQVVSTPKPKAPTGPQIVKDANGMRFLLDKGRSIPVTNNMNDREAIAKYTEGQESKAQQFRLAEQEQKLNEQKMALEQKMAEQRAAAQRAEYGASTKIGMLASQANRNLLAQGINPRTNPQAFKAEQRRLGRLYGVDVG